VYIACSLLHGSGGINGGNEPWAKESNEMGIASLLLDSFSGRGLVSRSTDQALLGRLNMILDAYRAFDVLATHPRIDAARIAVIGFSRGGQSALYSSLRGRGTLGRSLPAPARSWGEGRGGAPAAPLQATRKNLLAQTRRFR
jgi:dienelactone hydrolase